MHLGRLFPYRLSLFALVVLSGCATSDRYIGSIGHDGTYSNRGYGFAVRLKKDGLDGRWTVFDPQDPKIGQPGPRGLKPVLYETPIDLDGDGWVTDRETTRFLRPALLLAAKGANDTTMSVDVLILHPKERRAGMDVLLLRELRRAAGTSSVADTAAEVIEAPLASDFRARIGEIAGRPRSYRVAIIDQDNFLAEGGKTRRQLVRVVLSAPQITPELRQDQDTLLSALLLSRRAGPETAQEKW